MKLTIALAAVVAAAVAAPDLARADSDARKSKTCVDREIADRLAVKRKRRGYTERLFIKHRRHEFTLQGGYYVSDLYSSTYVAGGAYTYHMTEQTAIEMSAAITNANAELIRAIEDDRGETLDEEFSQVRFFESVLVWTPIYGKLRMGGSVMRFDLHVNAGVGVVDSETSRGVTGVGGLGMKLFLGKAVALRLDVRDHVYQQELLDANFTVNDVSATMGLSLFLPLRN